MLLMSLDNVSSVSVEWGDIYFGMSHRKSKPKAAPGNVNSPEQQQHRHNTERRSEERGERRELRFQSAAS